jgi:Bacterial TSP3 repeat
MKAVHWLGIALTLSVVSIPAALARPPYRLQAIAQLGYPADADGKASVTCQFCHEGQRGGKPWNAFGDLVVDKFFGDANKDINQALYMALQEDLDSDGDGYSDALEVVAKTNPGSDKSMPNVPVDTLEAELKAWGGVDSLFKPAPK